MEHTRHDRLFIHLKVCKDDPHPQRMDDIWLAGFPHLIFMRVFRDAVRFLDHGDIGGGVVLSHPCDQSLIELVWVLIILRSFHSVAVHDLKILIQLLVLKCCRHIITPLHQFIAAVRSSNDAGLAAAVCLYVYVIKRMPL